ncbi:MAG: MerR family transcriptional regulator [Saprospiraceae bacterium]|nr:MerR family transcriptional regulator [Saprospiraceae bacterium]
MKLFEDQDPNLKRYYSIGEVADMFGISKSVIRFWENEFDSLRPHKNSKGDRRFTQQNIQQLQEIHTLVKQRGFTIDGARRELKQQKSRQKQKKQVIDRLKEIRGFLENLQQEL